MLCAIANSMQRLFLCHYLKISGKNHHVYFSKIFEFSLVIYLQCVGLVQHDELIFQKTVSKHFSKLSCTLRCASCGYSFIVLKNARKTIGEQLCKFLRKYYKPISEKAANKLQLVISKLILAL